MHMLNVLLLRWPAYGGRALVLLLVCSLSSGLAFCRSVRVRLSEKVSCEPVSGTVFLLLSDDGGKDPIYHFLTRGPVYRLDVDGWTNGRILNFSEDHHGFPRQLGALKDGRYSMRAVLDRSSWGRDFVFSEGNAYSSKKEVVWKRGGDEDVELVIEHVYKPDAFEETDRIRELRLASERLTHFHHRQVFLEAAVVLPQSYGTHTHREYPVVYIMPGWGTTHQGVLQGDVQEKRYGMNGYGREKIYIFLNHECRYGFHCFADSDCNGPWAQALIEELIPEVERRYRVLPGPSNRFLIGQSSGAWGCLWLFVNHPQQFGAVFAASPDYVDFRDFGEGRNLYAPDVNMLYHASGEERDSKSVADRERLIGDGTQTQSFEAVFGPCGPDGRPVPLYDRKTGRLDPEVVRCWSRYDLSAALARSWPEKGVFFAKRLFIFVAEDDDYGLDESAKLMAQRLLKGGGGLNLRVYPEGGHNVWNEETRRFIHDHIEELLPPAEG